MEADRSCPACGAPLVPALAGLCPACLSRKLLRLDSAGSTAPLGRVRNYELLEELGEGGMGVVYLARQSSSSRLMALKRLKAEVARAPGAVERFRQEYEAAARLHHPGIVPVYEASTEDPPFFTMMLIDGDTLAAWLERGRQRDGTLSPERLAKAVDLLAQTARAVHHAHQHGVLHRDLKPTNVLLDAEDQPFVSDFGLAKVLLGAEAEAGATHASVVVGTPAYMAPEQAVGGPAAATTTADIYSLGAILYDVLTGRPPFAGDTPVSTALRACAEAVTPPRQLLPNIPPALEAICLKCLEKEPQRRYASAAALADDLERFARGEPVSVRPANRAQRFWMWARRNRAKAGLGLAAVVLLVGLLIFGGLYLNERAGAAELAAQAAREKGQADRIAGARAAAARGDWATALTLYEAALADDPPEALALRVERLRGWFAVNDPNRLRAALAELPDGPRLGPHAATVLLMRGDLLLTEPGRQTEARALLEEALRNASTLAPADRCYARGLMEPLLPDAMEHFQQAVRHDPFHHRAQTMLVLGLIFLGKSTEAREQLQFLTPVFTRDPFPRAALALLEVFAEADWGAVDRSLQDIPDTVTPDQRAKLRECLKVLHDMLGVLKEQTLGVNQFFQLVSPIGHLRHCLDAGNGTAAMGLLLPAFPWLRDGWGECLIAVVEAGLGQFKPALDRLERAVASHPEAIFWWLLSGIHTLVAAKLVHDEEGQLQLTARVCDTFEKAMQAPTVVPWIRTRSRQPLNLFAAMLHRYDRPRPGDPNGHRLFLSFCRMFTEGSIKDKDRETLVPAYVQNAPPTFARLMLLEWQLHEPTNPKLLPLRARLEHRDGNYWLAAKLAGEVLQKGPDKAMEALRQDSLQRMREQP